ncbi:hypothetical protein PINS_up004818 [Pythium insidiosum]|nr:hypothetical protein PINS_up004818 [Pythium insidiosum]
MTDVPRLVESSTQTDPARRSTSSKPASSHPAPTPGQTVCCKCDCHRGAAAKEGLAAEPKVDATVRKQVKPRRQPSATQRYNPIYMNARYPPEPAVFRGRTTYSSEYGDKSKKWR